MTFPDAAATPFNNSIVGQQGTLVRAQIKSPNFSLAGQTGWAILKNGSAYFFNITATGTITATQFSGTDFNINSAGAFFYSGTPALGNLFLSLAAAAGSDSFTNPFVAGVQIHGSGGQSIILNISAGFAELSFPTGAAEEVVAAFTQVTIANPGASEVLQAVIRGATSNTAARGGVSISLDSDAKDSSSGAAGVLAYLRNIVFVPMAQWTGSGFRVFAGGIPGDTNTYQPERLTIPLTGSVTISTTAQTQIGAAAVIGQGQYVLEGQLIMTPNAAGGTAAFQFTAGGGASINSSALVWDDILPGGAPYTNAGASYADPGIGVAFGTATLTAAKHFIRFRGLVNVGAAGTLALFATEAGGASYVVNSRATFWHLYPVGP